MRKIVFPVLSLLLMTFVSVLPTHAKTETETIHVGSKQFTESVIMGHLMSSMIDKGGFRSIHQKRLGTSSQLFEALKTGRTDLYVEYTGTLKEELFPSIDVQSNKQLRTLLARDNLRMSEPLGFHNNYALAIQKETAQKLDIQTISDLKKHPELSFGFTKSFVDRDDGWNKLKTHYGFSNRQIDGMSHDRAYKALKKGNVDVIDVYTTDASIRDMNLTLLEDDRDFWPSYEAVILYRSHLEKKAPYVLKALQNLAGTISNQQMREMNWEVDVSGKSTREVAKKFVKEHHQQPVVVGSKKFTEAALLGNILSLLVRHFGHRSVNKGRMGGSGHLFRALKSNSLDMYVEYSGTITQQLLSEKNLHSLDDIRQALAKQGIGVSRPLGFKNNYALAMKEQKARKLGIQSISDLRDHPDLTFGFTNEFMKRDDGWPGLQSRYNLPQSNVSGMSHSLAYQAIDSGEIDLMELYTTDARIEKLNLQVLKDDRRLWPEYQAVILYRKQLEQQAPLAVKALKQLEGAISETDMINMNSAVKLQEKNEKKVAQNFLSKHLKIEESIELASLFQKVWTDTKDHFTLVAISMLIAICLSIPLGIIAAKSRLLGQPILIIVGILQTVPAFAMLAFMVPLLGIGPLPAIAALFLYSLLPIVRNTYAGLNNISDEILESAEALGLPPFQRLYKIELPIAMRSILAGIKISVVINVGTATLGTLIGTGGYGDPIMTGIDHRNMMLVLRGTIPASAMAIGFQMLCELSEYILVSPGIRQSSDSSS